MHITTKIPLQYLFNKVKIEMFYVLLIWLIIHYFTMLFKENLPVLTIAIPTFLGTAISVLLSFKLNQSYDRWWEARKIWGSIVNDSRSLVLQLQTFVAAEGKSEIKEIAYRHIAWCYSLGLSLRNLDAVSSIVEYISLSDVEKLQNISNKPLGLLQQNALQIKSIKEKGQMDIFSLVQLNETLVKFSNAMGMAERIKSTVFPVTYRLFLHFLIYVFVITLSIALSDLYFLFELPLILVISLSFFILEKTARNLQDPFRNKPTDTAMTTIARTIEINIKQLLEEKEVPKPLAPESFYAM